MIMSDTEVLYWIIVSVVVYCTRNWKTKDND